MRVTINRKSQNKPDRQGICTGIYYQNSEEVGHDHVHSFFAELAHLIDRIFYVNF